MSRIRSVVWFAAVAAAVPCAAPGAIVVRNAATPSENSSMFAQWTADCGSPPAFTVGFESGFTSGQNISGVAGLFPGGVVFRDGSSAGSAVVWSGSFGGSQPIGVFGLRHNEAPFLRIEIPLPGADGVAFHDIDTGGTNVSVVHADGSVSTFSLETTGQSGASAEFVGVFRNDRPPIVRVDLDASGDGTWGIDDISFVPTPVGCDSIDFNGDGLFPDNQDLEDFLSVFGGGPCSTGNCNDIDFNNDGLFPDNEDIEAFFRVFGGGVC